MPIPPSPHPQASDWDCSTEQQQNLDRIHLTIIQVILEHPGTVWVDKNSLLSYFKLVVS